MCGLPEEVSDGRRFYLNPIYSTKSLKSQSRFKQYYFRLARELKINPRAIVYANLFSWVHNNKTPMDRPHEELMEVTSASLKLLAAEVRYLKPDFAIFACGVNRTDRIIKILFNDYLVGYRTSAPVIAGKLWEFEAENATCYRIAHPRALHGHGEFRDEVLARIKLALEQDQLAG